MYIIRVHLDTLNITYLLKDFCPVRKKTFTFLLETLCWTKKKWKVKIKLFWDMNFDPKPNQKKKKRSLIVKKLIWEDVFFFWSKIQMWKIQFIKQNLFNILWFYEFHKKNISQNQWPKNSVFSQFPSFFFWSDYEYCTDSLV